MKSQTCIIEWKSSITGKEGHGITRFSEFFAKEICHEANCKYKEIDHWYDNFPEN